MQLVSEAAENYARQFSSPLDNLLKEIEDFTLANHPHAQMLSGHVQGRVLEMLSSMIVPQRILEIGTFTGFSALCLAKGLAATGLLHTIELREEDAARAQAYFSQSPLGAKIKLHIGDAQAIIPALSETWDIVFIDADKVNYINYYELTLPRVRKGGWIIADNVLFHGQVLETPVAGKNAKAIHAFNEHVRNDPRVEEVLLTVRDGLLVIRKN
ncbi:MAG: O-methyltransferase [Ferruginibacter sp.]